MLGESRNNLGSSGDMSGVKLEGAALGESGTEIGYSGEMSGGNLYGKLKGSALGE